MDPHRKLWNHRHQTLNRALAQGDRDAAIAMFLDQHAMVHSAKVSKSKLWSFEDELLADLTEPEIRHIPTGREHSIAWILFHLARVEDMTMNLLVAGTEQLFTRDNWAKTMNVSILHSANKMDRAGIEELGKAVDIDRLLEYRLATARRTRQIVQELKADDFNRKVELSRIEKILAEGAVTPEAKEIVEYWSKKTIAGLLLMPPTRHCILHLNEGMRIREKVRRERE